MLLIKTLYAVNPDNQSNSACLLGTASSTDNKFRL